MNLSLKAVLAKILARCNLRQVSVTASSATTIAASGTTWITVPLPSSGTTVAVVGYYLNGGTTCSVYSMQLDSSGAQYALKNFGSSSQTVTITAKYLVSD